MCLKINMLSLILTISTNGCEVGSNTSSGSQNEPIPQQFRDYWYAGLAEINSYDLRQSRYGEIREGDAVLVFVTEDFSKSKHVKLDYPDQAGRDKVSVLKLNTFKKFHTGIYDYAIMQSVFTPVEIAEYPHSLKLTFSAQDWCGQSFMQFNLKGDHYQIAHNSYFETEGDLVKKLPDALLEDEIWTRLRIQPESIPTGHVDLIPSATFARLQHVDLKVTKARITKEKLNNMQTQLKIEYLHLERTITIHYESVFPYKIIGWEENDGQKGLSKATLKKSIKSDYWTKNRLEFDYLRDTLGLRF